MKIKLAYNDFMNVKLQLIFDYYDQPLSFVGKIKSQNYLFYFISNQEWFITMMDQDIANRLNELKNLTKLYKYLYQNNKLTVVTIDFDKEQVKYTSAKQYKDVNQYLPITNKPITFDYKHNMKVTKSTDLHRFLQ